MLAAHEPTDDVLPDADTADTRMALVYRGPGKWEWVAMPRPTIRDPGDAVVRVTATTV